MKKTKQITPDLSLLSERLVGGKLSELATYSDLFIRSRDGIFLLDPKTLKVLECNPSAQQLLGTSAETIQGDDLLKWIEPENQDRIHSQLQRSIRSQRAEIPFDCSMGNGLVLELSACGIKLADYGEILQVIAKDVTEVRLAKKELEEMNHKLKAASITDEMTQIHNFRHFMTELEKEHHRSTRYKTHYSVIFCDVDHFKNYNDKNGHPAGDEALKRVAKILSTRARGTDLCARYGGEEFVVLCPGTSLEQAIQLAENLRKSIEEHDFPHGAQQPLGKMSLSLGVGTYPDHGSTFKSVLESADEGVYASKHAGRNRVSTAPDSTIKNKKSA